MSEKMNLEEQILLTQSFFSVMAESQVSSPSGARLNVDDATLKGRNFS